MDLLGYEIFVLDQSLPKLEETWVEVELGAQTYSFRKSSKVSQTFDISGYIYKGSMAETRLEAKGLNDALLVNPSGTFTDGYGDTYNVYVVSWDIKPVPGTPKWTFSMSFRVIS